jgi:hypothetical protein
MLMPAAASMLASDPKLGDMKALQVGTLSDEGSDICPGF